jgi:hypothetical protein
LRAIEEDDLKGLPGTFFYKSFVKQYAATLGVPEQEILPWIDQTSQAEAEIVSPGQAAASSAVRQPDPIVQASNRDFSDRRLGIPVAVLGAVILACSGFYSWWTRPVPVQVATQIPTQTQVVPPGIAPGPAQPVTPVAASAPSDLGGVVLSLAATERTWLSITSGGKEIFSGVLQPGETKTVSGLEAARMKVGNAGGIEIQWNGKPVGPIGTRGQVKTIVFTPDNLEILEPPPPSSETL